MSTATNTNSSKKPDMTAVPPAVRRAAEEAQRRLEEEAARRNGSASPEPPAPQPEPPAPAPQPEPPAPAPQPPVPQPEPPAPPADPQQMSPEQLLHALRSEQGRTQALRRDMQTLNSQMNEMRELLANMNKAPPAQPTPPAPPAKIEWTQEEIEQWGEALPIIEKKAKELIAPLEMQFREAIGRVEQGVQTVAKTSAKTARERMISALDANTAINPSPERTWVHINEEDDFVDWLNYPDGLSGQRRYDMLMEAWNSNDASRVAAFFSTFLKESALLTPPTAQPGNGAAKPQPAASLESLAAPGRPRSAAPTNPGGQPSTEIITTGDIARFYRDVQTGRWKGREEEQKQYEAKIFAAQRAGNVRQGPPQP